MDESTAVTVFKLTVEGGLLRESNPSPAMQALKALESQGKAEIHETDRERNPGVHIGWPGGPPPVKPKSRFRAVKKTSGGVSFQALASMLFPSRDPSRLTMTEVNCVSHLLAHHAAGRSIFVTNNAAIFLDGGRREKLMSAFKIVVLTPAEAVKVLHDSGVK